MYGCGAAPPHRRLWDQRGVCSLSSSRVLLLLLHPRGAVRGTATIKRASLHVRQRQSAHVSNCITQTTCIRRLLLAFPRVAAFLTVHIVEGTEGREAALLGNWHLFFFFTRFLIYTSSWFIKTQSQSQRNHHPGSSWCSKAAECRFRSRSTESSTVPFQLMKDTVYTALTPPGRRGGEWQRSHTACHSLLVCDLL